MFCAGGDLKSFADQGNGLPGHVKEVTAYLHAAISRFVWMDAPVVAAVNGPAGGAGLSLVCATDLAIAAESAKFVMAYTRAGLAPDGSSTYFLSKLIGMRRAKELALTNRTLSAAEALEWGLINRVVPDAELAAAAGELPPIWRKGRPWPSARPSGSSSRDSRKPSNPRWSGKPAVLRTWRDRGRGRRHRRLHRQAQARLQGPLSGPGDKEPLMISADKRYRTKRANVDAARWPTWMKAPATPSSFCTAIPTSSYLWRNVIPHLEGKGRCIAPDLIGMGESDKIPKSGPGQLPLRRAPRVPGRAARRPWCRGHVIFVVHDWGSTLAFDWANRHRDSVQGLAYMEAVVCPLTWDDWPGRRARRLPRVPLSGRREMVIEKNIFVEKILPRSVLRGLTEDENEGLPSALPGSPARAAALP